ncbi:DUF1405 domain-containing protein [Shouchella lonarensis]|uniref:Uncharacterized membrane protein YpjA n=1 Tax=Shouchella lonarensis TaxID=1464122 RepID=A0A1G6J424_9BACI|nr:DUF1405 domain-containing protein [Shouchella lonarensis]SDC13437.1 Uncharacterized membrane protein YpjA [Shouchella lonarensis]
MFAYMIGLLGHRYSLWALLMINGLGTIYGYMWYWKQLQATPLAFIPFVPDSPTASLFFVLVLIGCLLNRHWGLLQAFAAVTLIKYGVWAVVMNVFQVIEGAPFHWQIWMLTLSHAGMALQALLFMPFFRIKGWHLMVVFTWVVLNDVMDYFFDMHPWLSSYIMPYIGQIGLFTFGLSLASVALVYFLRRPERSEKTEALVSSD